MKWITLQFIVLFISVNLLYSQSWVEQTSGVATSLNSVSAIDSNNVWVCGNGGVVLRTTNGGTNWTNVSALPIPAIMNLTNIFGVDANTALVTGTLATVSIVFRTSNAGVNWVPVFTQQNGNINSVQMGNAFVGFMVGNPVGGRWSLWGTITGGLTWDSAQFNLPQNGSETGFSNSFFFDAVSQAVWFGTNGTHTYRSTNLILWSSQQTAGLTNSSAIWFNSGNNGMTGGTAVMFTTNNGANWSPTTTALPGSGSITAITGTTSNWWVTRLGSAIYYTGSNDGSVWITSYTAPAGNYNHINKARTGVTTTIYGVRSNGGITKGTDLLVGLIPTVNEIPKYFNLKQNYPNPFNPSTKISFGIPSVGQRHVFDVHLIIYDELGREVAVLVNQNLTSGAYEVNFDASNISSGVYYYRLTAGSYSESKKMSILK